MATKNHIYVVTVAPSTTNPLTVQRLVRATTKQKALAHVVADTCHVALATQDELVSMGAAGLKVEDARS